MVSVSDRDYIMVAGVQSSNHYGQFISFGAEVCEEHHLEISGHLWSFCKIGNGVVEVENGGVLEASGLVYNGFHDLGMAAAAANSCYSSEAVQVLRPFTSNKDCIFPSTMFSSKTIGVGSSPSGSPSWWPSSCGSSSDIKTRPSPHYGLLPPHRQSSRRDYQAQHGSHSPTCLPQSITFLRSTSLARISPFYDNINFHKTIAAAIAVGVILHAGNHLACYFPRPMALGPEKYRPVEGDFGDVKPSYIGLVRGVEGVTGIIMVVLMALAFTLATSRFRRSSVKLPKPLNRMTGYNAFWYSHHLLFASMCCWSSMAPFLTLYINGTRKQ